MSRGRPFTCWWRWDVTLLFLLCVKLHVCGFQRTVESLLTIALKTSFPLLELFSSHHFSCGHNIIFSLQSKISSIPSPGLCTVENSSVKNSRTSISFFPHYHVLCVFLLRLTPWSAAQWFRPTALRLTAATQKTRGRRWSRNCLSGSWFTPGDTKPPRLTEKHRPEMWERERERGREEKGEMREQRKGKRLNK